MRTILSIVVLCLAALPLAVAGGGKASIVGEWSRTDGKSKFKFEADGNCTLTLFVVKGDDKGAAYKGTYKQSGKELSLKVGPLSGQRTILELTADRLVLDGEKKQEFKRVK